MRHSLVAWCAVLAAVATTTIGGAANAKPGKDGIRRDPAGQKGISPYNELLARGRKAFQDKDLEGAISAFQQAVQLDGEAMSGYLLLAQTQVTKGDHAAATQSVQDGRQKPATESLQSKMLILDADLSERTAEGKNEGPDADPEATWKAPKDAWSGYAAFVGGHPKAPDYRQSATERDKQIDARVKREKDYVIVRKRIADNAKKRAK